MKIRFLTLLLLLCLLMCANTLYAQELVSANPRYAAVVLPEFGGKSVSIIFDESAGTGKEYDTVYVDANLDGSIGESEKYAADAADPEMKPDVISSFPDVTLKPSRKISVSYQMTVFYSRLGAIEDFGLYMVRNMRYKGKAWQVGYSVTLKPTKAKGNPFICKPIRVPKAVVKSGLYKKATGIAVSLDSGDVSVSSPQITANLVLKNRSGRIIKKVKGALEKFGFG